jgi:hypothetical protein
MQVSSVISAGAPKHTKALSDGPRSSILTKKTKLASMRHLMITAIVEGNREQVCTELAAEGRQ